MHNDTQEMMNPHAVIKLYPRETFTFYRLTFN